MQRFISRFAVLAFAAVAFGPGATASAFESKKEEADKYQKVLKSSKDAKERAKAFEKLGELAQVQIELARPAIPEFVEALKDKDATVRAAAAHAIGKIDVEERKDFIKTLIDMMKNDKSDKVKEAAARGLGEMGPDAKEAIPAIKEAGKAAQEAAGSKKEPEAYRNAMQKINKKN